MHKKVISFLLSAAIVLGLFCGAAPTAHAASNMSASDECVNMIKKFEGFSKYPYYDNGQYTVGYGTSCPDSKLEEYKSNGISESEAEALLQEHLDSYEASLNSFAKKYGLSWKQNQFDALLSFTYNCGSGWLSSSNSSTIRSAIVNGAKGNDLIFAMGQWSTASGKVLPSLVERRLAEANMYLNGVYSTTVPSNYKYVLFDANLDGAETKVRVQAYDASLGDSIRATPTSSGNTFSGWYTKSSGGTKVTWLDEDVSVTTLYAHWNSGSAAEEPIATGVVAVAKLNVRSGAGTTYEALRYITKGEKVNIYETKTVDGTVWGRIDDGWVVLEYVTLDSSGNDTSEDKVIATGVVTASSLNVRSGAGSGYSSVGTLSKGTSVEIYETKTVDGTTWGRIESGWISMSYVALDSTEEQEEDDTVLATGTVTTSTLYVRSGPGSDYTQVGYVYRGDRVNIYETKTVSGTTWGRIDGGWISLDYVESDMAAPVLTVSNVASSGKIRLTWTAVKGAAGYKVYRSTQETKGFKLLKSTEGTSMTNTGAEAGQRYYYYVVAVDKAGIPSQASSTEARVCDLARPTISISNVASSGKIKVTWEAVEGAVKYEVYRATSKDGTYTRKYTTTGTTYTNSGAESGQTYYYKVRAIGETSAANSAFSTVKYRTCDLPRPTVSISNVASSGKIRLTWQAVEGAVKYEVYRSTSKNGTYTKVYSTSGTGYTNTSAKAGQVYYYKVKAIAADSAADSAFSSVKYRTCDLPQPELNVTLNDAGKPALTWKSIEGAVSYEIYRATSKNGEYSLLKTVSGTKFTNTSAQADVTYYYRIVAVASDTAANSAKSAVVSVTSK